MDLFLQIWGGLFYLLNKVFLFMATKKGREKSWKTWGWGFYILGLPPWLIILSSETNWIAVGVEAGGLPAMILGFIQSWRGKSPFWLEKLSQGFLYIFLAIGIGYSLYDYGGITTVNQILELSGITGFLLGTYWLAKGNINGWWCFGVMNFSICLLMLIQDKDLLATQQILSLIFTIMGAFRSRRTD